jgi:hypothetical protein
LEQIVNPKKLLRSEQEQFSNVYDYGDYRMFEGIDGQIKIEKEKFTGTYYGDAKVSEEYMSYNPKTPKFNKKVKKFLMNMKRYMKSIQLIQIVRVK